MKQKKILPPTYFLLFLVLLLTIHFVWPGLTLIPRPYNYSGILFMMSGILINIWASNFFAQVDTSIKPFTESRYLATEGLYTYSRNPMYSGMVMVLAGVAILLGSLTPWLLIVLFMGIITQQFIRFEEQSLEEQFGESYLQYKQNVRRWV